MNRKYKKPLWAFLGGISGLLVGGYLLFQEENLFGFLLILTGVIFLLREE